MLALGDQTAAELSGVAQVTLATSGDGPAPGAFDAIAGPQAAAPAALAALGRRLRPGGRLILIDPGPLEALLAALTAAGFIHCLAEPCGAVNLYRGERSPQGSSIERLQALSTATGARPASPAAVGTPAALALPLTDYRSLNTPYLFLLITQTPNKPVWKLAPGERLAWRALTVLGSSNDTPVLLAFSSLVKAVAFMQSAILARAIAGVNKVGKFPASAAQVWGLPLSLNPAFETVRPLTPGTPFEVDPRSAVAGDE